MSAEMIQELNQKIDAVELTAADRCIGCGAQAYVRAETLELGDFLFCRHDWNKNKGKIEPLSLHVHDETSKLLPKPYDPATDND